MCLCWVNNLHGSESATLDAGDKMLLIFLLYQYGQAAPACSKLRNPCCLLLKNKDEWEAGEQAEAEWETPGGMRLTQAESAPVAALPCPSPPPLGKAGPLVPSAPGSFNLHWGLSAFPPILSFCLSLFVSVSLSFFLPVNCLHFSVWVCFSVCLSVSLAYFIHRTPLWRPWLSHAARFIITGSSLMDPPFFGCVPLKVWVFLKA